MKTRKITSDNKDKPKYQKTFHAPFSETITSDDKVMKSLDHFEGLEVVVLTKMDGENHSMTLDYQHARSVDSSHHPSQSWIKGFHSAIRHSLDPNVRYCGEDLYAMHSIKYNELESYFLCFNTWDRETNTCHSWDETTKLCEQSGISTVPVLYRGVFDYDKIKSIFDSMDKSKDEGIVIRLADEFHYDDFSTSVAKAVRKDHIDINNFVVELVENHNFTLESAQEEAEKHWSKRYLVKNKLK